MNKHGLTKRVLPALSIDWMATGAFLKLFDKMAHQNRPTVLFFFLKGLSLSLSLSLFFFKIFIVLTVCTMNQNIYTIVPDTN
jgi:hypothetical protein